MDADALTGFHPLRPGRIHLWCPKCHRKLSNVKRAEYDPEAAVVAAIWCPNCVDGGFSEGALGYYDEKMEEVSFGR